MIMIIISQSISAKILQFNSANQGEFQLSSANQGEFQFNSANQGECICLPTISHSLACSFFSPDHADLS